MAGIKYLSGLKVSKRQMGLAECGPRLILTMSVTVALQKSKSTAGALKNHPKYQGALLETYP